MNYNIRSSTGRPCNLALILQMDADVAMKAQSYLEKNLHNLTSPAALAATVLALVLARLVKPTFYSIKSNITNTYKF